MNKLEPSLKLMTTIDMHLSNVFLMKSMVCIVHIYSHNCAGFPQDSTTPPKGAPVLGLAIYVVLLRPSRVTGCGVCGKQRVYSPTLLSKQEPNHAMKKYIAFIGHVEVRRDPVSRQGHETHLIWRLAAQPRNIRFSERSAPGTRVPGRRALAPLMER